MAPSKKYTINDKINILTRLRANGNNISKISVELCVDRQCIKRWVSQESNFFGITNKKSIDFVCLCFFHVSKMYLSNIESPFHKFGVICGGLREIKSTQFISPELIC